MELMKMQAARRVAPDIEALTTYVPVPGFGILPVNAFLIRAAQPVLVDTGIVALGDAFVDALRSTIAIEDLRWIWLTHTDPDHIGALHTILEEAPRARLVTTFLGMGKIGLGEPVPPERVHLLNPGQTLEVGDRTLLALRPPCFDAPETTGLFDPTSGALFSADAFGAVMASPADSAAEISSDELGHGLRTWATVDAPWLASLDERAFGRALDVVRQLEPRVVLSSHLPPASGLTEVLLGHLDEARLAPPFVGPDQDALERMLRAA